MRRIASLLVVLAVVASGCAHDHASHEHDDETQHDDSHDDGSHGQEAGYDHHGNPLSEQLFYDDVTVDGTRVEFTIQTFLGVGGRGGHVVSDVAAGSHAAAIIHVTDAETGASVAPSDMLGWIGAAGGDSCADTVNGFLSGSLTRAPIVDLSAFFVLALNRDAGISVIDPSVDVAGMTQLFTVIPLIGPGSDWALTRSNRFAAVSIPSTAQVAIVDLESFETMAHLDVGGAPAAVFAEPTRDRAWVVGTGPGISVVDLSGYAIAFEIELDDPLPVIAVTEQHTFAGSASELRVFSTGSGALRAAVEMPSGDITALVGDDSAAWVATETTVAAFDPTADRLWERPADGVTGLWLTDGGTTIVAATRSGALFIDAATGDLLAEIDTGGRVTDAVDAFGETVLAVPDLEALIRVDPDRLGAADAIVMVELGTTGMAPTISISEDRGAIIVAVPGQDQVQLIPAGATAPAGAFQGHGLIPTATATVDRSFVETAPGVFTGRFRAPEPGAYQLAVLMDDPRVVECFDFEVAAPAISASSQVPDVSIVAVDGERAGEPTTVTIAVDDVSGHDIEIMVMSTAGAWQQRMPAEAASPGSYRASLTFPTGGVYQLFVRIPDLGLDFGSLPNFYLDVSAA